MEGDFYEEAGARGWTKPSALQEKGKCVEWHYRPAHPEAGLSLFGATYPIKETLKEMGFRWEAQRWKKKPCAPEEALEILGKLDERGVCVRAYV